MSRKETITTILQQQFQPMLVEVVDESHMHDVPEGAESHFKVTLVCDRFDGEPLIRRHRAVNEALSELLSGDIHALALHTMSPQEWFDKGGEAPESPPCLGGSKESGK